MSENNNNQKQLQIELPQEVAQGEYANFAIITHEHAKRLLAALQENIVRYEREFGAIKIPQQEPRTIAPFPVGKEN